MKSSTCLSAAMAIVGSVQAGPIAARQASFDFECNGQEFPNTTDCNDVFAIFNDPTVKYTVPEGGNVLTFYLDNSHNCEVNIQWSDNTYTVTQEQVDQGIHGVQTTCFPSGTGGSADDVGGRFTIGVTNNPDYKNPSKRMLERDLVPMGTRGEHIAVKAKKLKTRTNKRADGDTSFDWGVHTTYAKPADMKHNIGDGLPGGSTWTWSSSQSVTDHVGFSISVSAGIEDIISSSISTDVSEDKTYTSGSSSTITINCDSDDYGQVYFQGYAETWSGALEPSGDSLTVTVPMTNSDGSTAGFYSYDCIAS